MEARDGHIYQEIAILKYKVEEIKKSLDSLEALRPKENTVPILIFREFKVMQAGPGWFETEYQAIERFLNSNENKDLQKDGWNFKTVIDRQGLVFERIKK